MNLRRESGGFTLTEIAIAIGLAAFCLVAVMGLLPAGMNSNRASLEQTQAAALAGAIEEDLRAMGGLTNVPLASPRFGLLNEPSIPQQTLYFAEDGSPTNAAAASYRVTVRGPGPVPGTLRGPRAATVMITWPAAADANPAAWPTNARGQFETLVLLPSS
jgi:uncharacterized protein (TIGR02598 family)